MEDHYAQHINVDHQLCYLEVLDTGGAADSTTLTEQWIAFGEGFVLVYDVTSRSSFARIQNIYHQIKKVKTPSIAGSQTSANHLVSPVPQPGVGGAENPSAIIVGNKIDIATKRKVTYREGDALARALGCDFVEVSAKKGIFVEEAFYDLVRSMRQQREEQRRAGMKQESGLQSPEDSTVKSLVSPEGREGAPRRKCFIL